MPIEQALKMSSVFQGLSGKDLELLASVCREEVAIKGAVMFKQGESAGSLYLVNKGRIGLHMTLERPDGSSTGPKAVASIGPGEAFGWSTLVHPYISTLSATAVELSTLIALDGPPLYELLNKHRNMGYLVMVNLASMIAERLAETREAFVYDRSYVEYLQQLPKNTR